MEKADEKLLKAVAPCSLFCSTCTGCQYGDISYHAKELLRLLEGHEEFLDKNLKDEYRHKLEEYKLFSKKLKKYAYPKCGGCRDYRVHSCSIENCIIPECVQEHKIDFCGECLEFPCDKINSSIYSEDIINRWLSGNQEIKDVGIFKYYEDNKDTPHYIKHVKSKKIF